MDIFETHGNCDPDHAPPLVLVHDFHEVETLLENGCIRFTISPTAREELLKRLWAENHRRVEAEVASAPVPSPKKSKSVQNRKMDEDFVRICFYDAYSLFRSFE